MPECCVFHYQVRISYKGTNYRGWQAQAKELDPEQPTVQGTILQVLRRIAKYQDAVVSGTSRTDAGVHAAQQLAKISIPRELAADKLLLGLNSLLPADIRVVACQPCAAEYNPKTQKSTKVYHYYFDTEPVGNPLLADVVAHVPGPLDVETMQQAAQLFVGQHDFYSFYLRSSLAATTVRTVTCCQLKTASLAPLSPPCLYLDIAGQGFLKHMVRYIAGSLFAAGRGEVSIDQIRHHLQTRQDEKLAFKAKAHGLHLAHITLL